MTKLYTELAETYHAIYQQIFNYKKEFKFYNSLLKKHHCKSVLEIGCGSGNLANYFLEKKYEYIGLDFSLEMLKIARTEVAPKAKFVQGDMRNLKLKKKFDAVIITGRSFTYLLTNEEIMQAFSSIFKVLNKNGVLIFDNFNAEKFDLYWKKKEKFNCGGKVITRNSTSTPNLKTGFTKNWFAEYTIAEKGKKQKIIKDESVIRAFLISEIDLLLCLSKFKTIRTVKQEFGFTTIAQKQC